MKVIKPIFVYLGWILISLILGIAYMRLLLGENNFAKDSVTDHFFTVFYHWGIFYVGITIGIITAFLFIMTDVLIVKRKLTNKSKLTFIRIGVLLTIITMVTLLHYFLEKVIDVI